MSDAEEDSPAERIADKLFRGVFDVAVPEDTEDDR